MLVDDSLVIRSILEAILSEVDAIEVVASVAGATEALALLETKVIDVIVLDIEMPGVNGIAALPELIRKSAGARVIILSSNCEEGGPAALQALSLGAAETLAKPAQGCFRGQFAKIFADQIVELARDRHADFAAVDRSSPLQLPATQPTISHRPSEVPRCILIGSSTGGITALNTILKGLDDSISAPILLTQHLPDVFMPFFAKQLGSVTSRTVEIAEDGIELREGHLYLAPGNAHLTVAQTAKGPAHVVLSTLPAQSGCRPSVDPMFASAAEVFGAGALGIVLSGMGHDGTQGARCIRLAGGAVVAQSHESCVVWGMPGSIVNSGLASAVLDPTNASAYVNRAAQWFAP